MGFVFPRGSVARLGAWKQHVEVNQSEPARVLVGAHLVGSIVSRPKTPSQCVDFGHLYLMMPFADTDTN